MSWKVLTDTIQLHEFRNQRYLFGNLIPAVYGLFGLVITIFWFIPFELTHLPAIAFISMIAVICSYLAHYTSRKGIFFFCGIENHYTAPYDEYEPASRYVVVRTALDVQVDKEPAQVRAVVFLNDGLQKITVPMQELKSPLLVLGHYGTILHDVCVQDSGCFGLIVHWITD